MYKKTACFALAAALTTFATSSQSADKSAQKLEMQTEFLSDARNTISLCNSKYREFVQLKRMNQYAYEEGLRADEAMARLNAVQGKATSDVGSTKLEKTPEYHVLCIEKSKGLLLPRSKKFVSSFKTAHQQSAAKAMIAQWMTAIDSIGNEVGPTEAAKFVTLANGILIDLQ